MTDNRVRPPVPPEPSSSFDAVPRDWASTADRRAANAGSRFDGGTPSNEAAYGRDVATLRSGAPPAADVDSGRDGSAAPDVDKRAETLDVEETVNVDAFGDIDPGDPERPDEAVPVGDVVEDDETDLADAAQMVDAPVEEDVDSQVAPDTAYDDGAYDYEYDRDEAVDRAREAAEHHGTEVDWFAPAAAAAAGGAGALAPPDEYDYEYDARNQPAWNGPSGISPITRGERRALEAAAVAEAKAGAGLNSGFGQAVFALTRLLLGFVFLWAFLDKLFGLGRGTPRADAWRDGTSPTSAYLSDVDGPAAGFFNELAGRSWVDWLFMIGLAAIGVALILGIGLTITAIASTVLLGLIYVSNLPIASNPFVNSELVYALVIIGIAATGAGLRYSLAPWWRRTRLVRALRVLR